MASFSSDTKTEICGVMQSAKRQYAFLYGVVRAARQQNQTEIILQTECAALASLLGHAMRRVCPAAQPDTQYRARTQKLPLWSFTYHDKASLSALVRTFHLSCTERDRVTAFLFERELPYFAAGVFVACGSVNNPRRDYHLEMNLPDAALCDLMQTLLAQKGITAKQTLRGRGHILYLKQNEQISDALIYFGAQQAAMAFVHAQVYKSIRSQANRRSNCDLANINKTVLAGEQQLADIALIAERIGLQALPQNLQVVAQARLDAPEASLRDLSELLQISRSGVHHRLQKLADLAAELRGVYPPSNHNPSKKE